MRMRGFTLIELIITLAIIVIVSVIVLGGWSAYSAGQAPNVSFGVGGLVEERCVSGYKHAISDGRAQQIMDEFGKGVKC